jgi:hypothetical protein
VRRPGARVGALLRHLRPLRPLLLSVHGVISSLGHLAPNMTSYQQYIGCGASTWCPRGGPSPSSAASSSSTTVSRWRHLVTWRLGLPGPMTSIYGLWPLVLYCQLALSLDHLVIWSLDPVMHWCDDHTIGCSRPAPVVCAAGVPKLYPRIMGFGGVDLSDKSIYYILGLQVTGLTGAGGGWGSG